MKCDQATTWLLSSDTPADPPRAVARHLHTCLRCREVQTRLVRLESEAQQLFPPQDNAALRQFLNSLEQRCAPRAIDCSPETRSAWRLRRRATLGVAVTAAAVGLLFCGSWLEKALRAPGGSGNKSAVAHFTARPAASPEPSKATRNHRPLEAPEGSQVLDVDALQFLINNHVRLAVAETAEDRITQLEHLCNYIWQEIVRQAQTSPGPDIVALRQTYEYLVRSLLPRRVLELPVGNRDARNHLISTLKRRQAEAEHLASSALPAVAEVVLRVGETSAQAADWIAAGEMPPGAHQLKFTPASTNPVIMLVSHNLQISEESDPLRRAELSGELADELSCMIVFTSLRGDESGAEALGTCLAQVLDGSVATNLVRYENRTNFDPNRTDYQRVKEKSKHSLDVLERNLERAPTAARRGLERAIQAKQRAHGSGSPSGRGVPSARGDQKEWAPPGLKKKEKT